MATSIIRPIISVPRVSGIEGFHCIFKHYDFLIAILQDVKSTSALIHSNKLHVVSDIDNALLLIIIIISSAAVVAVILLIVILMAYFWKIRTTRKAGIKYMGMIQL